MVTLDDDDGWSSTLRKDLIDGVEIQIENPTILFVFEDYKWNQI